MILPLAASIVFLASGFVPRLRLVLSRRSRRWSLIIALAAVIVVAVPITLYTRARLTELRISSSVPELVKEWAPNATVESVSVDISTSPALVRVAITSPRAPGDPDALAKLISGKAGRDIRALPDRDRRERRRAPRSTAARAGATLRWSRVSQGGNDAAVFGPAESGWAGVGAAGG